MAIDRMRLREHLVFLEAADARRVPVDARGYQRAARALRRVVEEDLASLPMRAFMHDDLPALQTLAQNVFFEGRRRFADLDGSGHAQRACEVAQALLQRLRRRA